MLTAKLFQDPKGVSVRKDNRQLGLEEIESMSVGEIRQCEILILGKKFSIIGNETHGYTYELEGGAYFGCPEEQQNPKEILESAYSLASILYGDIKL